MCDYKRYTICRSIKEWDTQIGAVYSVGEIQHLNRSNVKGSCD